MVNYCKNHSKKALKIMFALWQIEILININCMNVCYENKQVWDVDGSTNWKIMGMRVANKKNLGCVNNVFFNVK